jgi:hypothetical protein
MMLDAVSMRIFGWVCEQTGRLLSRWCSDLVDAGDIHMVQSS